EISEKKTKRNKKTEKSNVSIFFLIISLISIILYGIYVGLNLDFNNLVIIDLIKPFLNPK
ncbi:MAG: hypothetical protein IJ391_03910, partial [Clostridia bacterium]|nr:hypothetical protein [Clostridia bacterium]